MKSAVILVALTSVAHADPAPDQASGVLVADDDQSSWLWAPRAALYPVHLATDIAFAPLRGTAWVFERYQLADRIRQALFSDDGNFGIYPTVLFETGFGWNAGVHLVDSDLFGHGEHLALEAGFGGEYKQRYDAQLTTGDLLGDSELRLRGSFRAWDRSSYFGIGNDDDAPHTRFAQNAIHVEATATHPIGPISVRAVGAFTRRTFSTDADLLGDEPILSRFDEMSLVGFASGTSSLYGEAGATLSTLAYASRYISRATPSTGWWVDAYAGYARGVDGAPSNYARYGADARRYIDLYAGDRVVVLRAALDAVTAHIDEIPFTDLPRLGGANLLRGFERDRFRDRVAALASVEYRFPIQEGIVGYAFVDAGRVAHELSALDPADVHVGYGGGFQIQTLATFLFRAQIAGSRDGTFLQLALDPTTDVRAKQRRL